MDHPSLVHGIWARLFRGQRVLHVGNGIWGPAKGTPQHQQKGFLLLFAPENEPASPLVSGIIDYNMPLTSTYLKQMKLRVMNSQEQVSTLSTLHPHLEVS